MSQPLKTWQTGERRTIHRRPYVRRKPLARRPSMLDAYVARIEEWLTVEPHLTAVAIVDRLHKCAPGSFDNRQRRTLQRFVKLWRAKIDIARTAREFRGHGRCTEAPLSERPRVLIATRHYRTLASGQLQ